MHSAYLIKTILFLWILGIVPGFVWSQTTRKDCDEVICIFSEQNGDHTQFHIQNRAAYDVIATLDFPKLRNLKPEGRLPVDEMIPAGYTLKTIALRSIDPYQDSGYQVSYNYLKTEDRSCDTKHLCITLKRTLDAVDFFIENQQDFAVGVILDLKQQENLSASTVLPYSAVVPARDVQHAFSLYRIERKKPWNYRYTYTHWRFEERACGPQNVCIITQRTADDVTFFIESLADHHTTLELSPNNLENYFPNIVPPFVATLAPKEHRLAFMLLKQDPNAPSGFGYQHRSRYGAIATMHDPAAIYHLPYASGTTHTVSQGFDGSFSHYGDLRFSIDWAMPIGTTVHAARGGTVIGLEASHQKGGDDPKLEGNYVEIIHKDGTVAVYGHLKPNGVLVRVGQRVVAGTPIAISGNTGYSLGPHLHFHVYRLKDFETVETLPVRFNTRFHTNIFLTEDQPYTAP